MPRTIHASCEDYRASAGIDLEHDRADLARKLRDAGARRVGHSAASSAASSIAWPIGARWHEDVTGHAL